MERKKTRGHPEKHWMKCILPILKTILKISRIALDERETKLKAFKKALDKVVNQTQRYIKDIQIIVG